MIFLYILNTPLYISKNNTLHSVRSVHLTHLTPERKWRIRIQRRIDVASWLCVTWHRPSWCNQDTDPYVLCVLTASGAALLRPGDSRFKGLLPWRRLIQGSPALTPPDLILSRPDASSFSLNVRASCIFPPLVPIFSAPASLVRITWSCFLHSWRLATFSWSYPLFMPRPDPIVTLSDVALCSRMHSELSPILFSYS